MYSRRQGPFLGLDKGGNLWRWVRDWTSSGDPLSLLVGTKQKDIGYTLIELLIVVFILALLCSLVVTYLDPGSSELRSAAHNLESFLYRAKSEAIKQNNSARISSVGSGLKMTVESKEIAKFGPDKGITLVPSHERISFSPVGTVLNSKYILKQAGKRCVVYVRSSGRIYIQGDCPE